MWRYCEVLHGGLEIFASRFWFYIRTVLFALHDALTHDRFYFCVWWLLFSEDPFNRVNKILRLF